MSPRDFIIEVLLFFFNIIKVRVREAQLQQQANQCDGAHPPHRPINLDPQPLRVDFASSANHQTRNILRLDGAPPLAAPRRATLHDSECRGCFAASVSGKDVICVVLF